MIPWLRVLHVIGVTLWIGGVLSVGLVGAFASGDKKTLEAARHASLRVATPGMILAFVGGLAMFIVSIDVYKSAGWVHIKLTLALVAAALTGVLSGKLRKAAAGTEVSAKALKGLSFGVLGLALVNIIMAFLGPIWMAR